MRLTAYTNLLLLMLAVPAAAGQDQLHAFVDDKARAVMATPLVQSALRVSNVQNSTLDDAAILDLDGKWRSQLASKRTPDIDSVLEKPASEELRKVVAQSGGTVLEIIAMDNRGLNAAISNITSDFWQGDEDKFQQTYLKGADAIHVSAVEFDDSRQAYVVQVSFVVTDAAGEPIGAATFSLDPEAF